MNILCIGDIVGSIGCEHLQKFLPGIKKLKNIHLTIANGENSADGNGVTPASAEKIFSAGADIITTGNHAFRRKEVYDFFEENEFILRPANFPENTTPGRGMQLFDMGRIQVCVINLMGVVYMEPLACPFETAQKLVDEARNQTNIILIDFHAEATAEKKALAYFLDGKISCLFGTHTHVQTADDQLLPNGTGFITDIGMTGPIHSVLGVKPEIAIEKMRGKLPVRFENAQGNCRMDGIIFEIDEKSGQCISLERISITD